MACLQFFRILKFQKEKKIWSNFSFSKENWLNLVKLLTQEVLLLHCSRILVLLNNYFKFLNFGQIWSNYDQIWLNYGQTVVKLIQEILVLLNNYYFFRIIVSNSNGETCDLMLNLNSWALIGLTAYYCQENSKRRFGN